MPDSEPSALKEMFNAEKYRQIAKAIAAVYPDFDSKKFLNLTLPHFASLNLLQRLRLTTESLGSTLPSDYRKALPILRRLAPSQSGFVGLFLPDFVGVYGRNHFDLSLEALKFFTSFGSSEFAIREFLRLDLHRTLATMEIWSLDLDPHVRRLASEGCRPRLPWSFRLTALVDDPSPVAPILENLRNDPSLYVRKSVANHLNDITKDHPEWVLNRIKSWPLEQPATAWIVKQALRTLIKKGDRRALTVIGAGAKAKVELRNFSVKPSKIKLGDVMTFSFDILSTSAKEQKLVVDYAIHYVKKSGESSAKVFKLKEFTLGPKRSVSISKRQTIKNFSTRTHHPGKHVVEIFINGELLAQGEFFLSI